jgi:hypothetical protein
MEGKIGIIKKKLGAKLGYDTAYFSRIFIFVVNLFKVSSFIHLNFVVGVKV